MIRSKEAVALKPNVVATACPFCLTNLEDGIKVLDKDKEVEVKDIIELVKEAST